MHPLNAYIIGYVITLFLILVHYGYEQEGDTFGDTRSDQIGFWFLSVMVSILWPILWSYYIPVLIGALIHKIATARVG